MTPLAVATTGALALKRVHTNAIKVMAAAPEERVAVAERVGWSRHPVVGPAYLSLGAVLIERGRLAEAESVLERADLAEIYFGGAA